MFQVRTAPHAQQQRSNEPPKVRSSNMNDFVFRQRDRFGGFGLTDIHKLPNKRRSTKEVIPDRRDAPKSYTKLRI
jgi:hypothetical protein